ncbi:hypothetical protein H1164_03780 [Thermoactinomyces daqus]|uniref:Uncharacterized protein n=1 Tax=Thermoactinomyces daqus TaxID=1329516 RepID=A0A7W1X8J9_9BACL|nr:helix-turn-helix domain-containing protein [Thermoactinomyces daqus]MBA4542021.1 hypothetical protein [Thermoactinomyces daqus]
MSKNEQLKKGAELAKRQKGQLMHDGGYAMITHEIGRDLLPRLVEEHGGRDARDAIALYIYLHAHTSGESANDLYLWAFPTVERICTDTGIDKNRLKKVTRILIDNGLLRAIKLPWRGNVKNVYLPLYFPINPSDYARTEPADYGKT